MPDSDRDLLIRTLAVVDGLAASLAEVKTDIKEMKASDKSAEFAVLDDRVNRMENKAKDDRTMVLGAVLSGIVAIVVSIVMAFVARGA